MSVDKRLEAGLGPADRVVGPGGRVAGSAGVGAVPVRRDPPRQGLGLGAFAAFLLYELVTLPWATVDSGAIPSSARSPSSALAMAVWLLLFALFDKRTPKYAANTGRTPGPVPGPAPGNPYLR